MHKPMPDEGVSREQILGSLDAFKEKDPRYKEGRVWSLVYYLDEEHSAFLKEAYHRFSSENGLNPGAFKSLKKMESEIISATADILRGTDEVCGVVTSGGTESCLMAVKTYRDMARDQRRVKKPEMIMPATAHVAWFKASEYFGVKIRLVPLKEDFTPAHVRKVYYWLAPALTMVPALLTCAVLPFGGYLKLPFIDEPFALVIADLDVGILFVFAIASLGVYGIVLA